jgi:hypothetical protein
MAVIPDRTVQQLFDLNKSFWASVSGNPKIPQSVKSMIYQHIQSQWVPNALAVVLAPLGDRSNPMIGQPVFALEGWQYYYPTLDFWMAHAEQSHPPQGNGCDSVVHKQFLTATGANPEFIYAVVKRDGNIDVQEATDFDIECAFFEAGRVG